MNYSRKVVVSVRCVYGAAFCGDSDEMSLHLANCLWGLCAFVNILDSAGYFLTISEVSAGREAGQAFLDSYVYLAHWGSQNGRPVCLLRPKLHYVQHLLAFLDRLPNPKATACWFYEDYTGQ